MPVAFQNPDPVTLFGLILFLYFLPLLQNKYHSLSPKLLLTSAQISTQFPVHEFIIVVIIIIIIIIIIIVLIELKFNE